MRRIHRRSRWRIPAARRRPITRENAHQISWGGHGLIAIALGSRRQSCELSLAPPSQPSTSIKRQWTSVRRTSQSLPITFSRAATAITRAQFCRCAADKTAEAYVAKPVSNLRYQEQLRHGALVQCGIADQSQRIDVRSPAGSQPAPPATLPVLASTACIHFRNNEKRIKSWAKAGRYTGDVIVVNDCASDVVVVESFADAYDSDAQPNICVHDPIQPGDHKVLRSTSPQQRPGLVKRIPKMNAFVCAGSAAPGQTSMGGSICGCASGVRQVSLPLPTGLP